VSHSTSQQPRKFGFTVGGMLALIGSISWWRGHETPPLVLWTIATLLVVPAAVFPRLLVPVERAWMKFAAGLAYVNTRIILTIVFYLIMMPVGAIRRLLGDPLNLRMGRGESSDWVRRKTEPVDPQRYRLQF